MEQELAAVGYESTPLQGRSLQVQPLVWSGYQGAAEIP